MYTNASSHPANTLKTSDRTFQQSLSNVRNALHVVLLIVPVVLWCGWCVWCVLNMLMHGLRAGVSMVQGQSSRS